MLIAALAARRCVVPTEELDISVTIDHGEVLGPNAKRAYRPDTRVLHLARWLQPGQRAFQLGTQLAHLTHSDLIASILATDGLNYASSNRSGRVSLQG